MNKAIFTKLIQAKIEKDLLLPTVFYTDDYKFICSIFKKLNSEKIVKKIHSAVNRSFKNLIGSKTPLKLGKMFAKRFETIKNTKKGSNLYKAW